MTPKEKANELLFKFNPKGVYWVYDNIAFNGGYNYEPMNRRLAFDCINPLIIAVNEILEMPKIASIRRDDTYMELEYWQEVKNEIENL